MLCLIVCSVIAVHRTLKANYSKLTLDKVKTRVGTLYKGMKTDRPEPLYYVSLFFIRRLLLAFSFIYVPLMPVQVLLNQLLSFFVIWFLIEYKPFYDQGVWLIELNNELFLVCLTDMVFFMAKDFLTSRQRFRSAWAYNALFLVCFCINMAYLFYSFIANRQCCKMAADCGILI